MRGGDEVFGQLSESAGTCCRNRSFVVSFYVLVPFLARWFFFTYARADEFEQYSYRKANDVYDHTQNPTPRLVVPTSVTSRESNELFNPDAF